jgi:hypothetical protein
MNKTLTNLITWNLEENNFEALIGFHNIFLIVGCNISQAVITMGTTVFNDNKIPRTLYNKNVEGTITHLT